MPSPDSVFLDLDETLVHTLEAHLKPEPGLPAPVRYGPYFAWLRPNALELLELVNSLGVPVFICSMSERAYAAGLSSLFKLGIPERNILGLEPLNAGRFGIAPGGVLIDDLEAEHGIVRCKRRVLGIGENRYFRIAAFRGFGIDGDVHTCKALKAFLLTEF